MKVFKFGGASVSTSGAVRNLADILEAKNESPLVVVVSAMGKTTNALEGIVESWHAGNDWRDRFDEFATYHVEIARDLLADKGVALINNDLEALESNLNRVPPNDYNEAYDRVVIYGELLSTRIIAAYLNHRNLSCQWIDARKMIITDSLFREANINWKLTDTKIRSNINSGPDNPSLVITQGFIAATETGIPTTLGREGSDFTAAIIAAALDAEEVVIWKDVEGLLNADPKYFGETCLLEAISYREAIELSYYGATIIHPKTIKPLQNKGIPLFVKSFIDPSSKGSVIRTGEEYDHVNPSYIFKRDQVLLTLSPNDFSFMDERMLAIVFQAFATEHIKLNLMQNSAISLSACFDYRSDKFENILNRLAKDFRVRYNQGLELITVRHYNEEVIGRITEGKDVLMEQRSRITAQFVAKPRE